MRELSREILTRWREQGGFLPTHFRALFEARGGLRGPERGAVVRRTLGILRSLRLLEFALENTESDRLSGERRDLGLVLTHELLEGSLRADEARGILGSVHWDGVLEFETRPEWLELDETSQLAVAMSFPDELVRRWIELEGLETTRDRLEAFNRPVPLTLRANGYRIRRDDLRTRLEREEVITRPTPLARDGLIVEPWRDVFRLPSFHEGLFEVQDEGSQLVGEIVDPPARGLVVDACAGAGGKSLHVAGQLRGKGQVVAVDLPSSHKKLEELKRRARRAGHQNIQTELLGPEGEFGPNLARLKGKARRVLTDVPCSGTGVLGRNPEARYRFDRRGTGELGEIQAGILERFSQLVAPGGRLIYSTCSLLPEENEAVVEAFLERHPEFMGVSPADSPPARRSPELVKEGDRYLRLTPEAHGTDGFFAAVLERRESPSTPT